MNCPIAKSSRKIVGTINLCICNTSGKISNPHKHVDIQSTYKAFLLIMKTTIINAVNSSLKIAPTTSTMSAVTTRGFCALPSQRSQRGRQVKFCSKKSSLQRKLVMIKGGRNSDVLIAEDSTREMQAYIFSHSNLEKRIRVPYKDIFPHTLYIYIYGPDTLTFL